MGIVYLAALILGLGITALQLVMSGDHGADHDVGGGHHDGDHGHHGHGGGGGSDLLAIVTSVRFWTFGALGFGLLGALLHYLHLASGLLAAALAVIAGIASGSAASLTFRALTRTATESGGESGDLMGQVGRVLVPLSAGSRGKIRVVVRGRTVDYIATTDEAAIEEGQKVLVEDIRGQELHVSKAPPELE